MDEDKKTQFIELLKADGKTRRMMMPTTGILKIDTSFEEQNNPIQVDYGIKYKISVELGAVSTIPEYALQYEKSKRTAMNYATEKAAEQVVYQLYNDIRQDLLEILIDYDEFTHRSGMKWQYETSVDNIKTKMEKLLKKMSI